MINNEEIYQLLERIREENRDFQAGVLEVLTNIQRHIKQIMTIDVNLLNQILDALDTALQAESTNVQTISQENSQIADLTAQIAPLPQDTQTRITNLLASAASANPPAATPPTDGTPTPDAPVVNPLRS